MLPALAVQVTAVLLDPVTVALNCLVAPVETVAVAGATLTVTGAAAVTLRFTGLLTVPPRPLLTTVMGTLVPTCAAVAVPVAFKPVGEISVVASAVVPKFTTELAAKLAPFREIVNCPTGTEVGEVLHSCTAGCVTVIVIVPNFVASAVLVACTVTALFMGTTAGAVYRPVAETVPDVELPPATPLTVQLTVVTASGTYAVNCLV